jgi:ketosteroid isomerase-like protein
MLVVDGGIDNSALLSRTLIIASTASDAASAAVQANSRVLLTQSLASDAASAAAQANSRVLVVKSDTSDLVSAMTILQSRVLVVSGVLSDTYSAVLLTQSMASDAASAAQQVNSRVLVVKSDTSDLVSAMTILQSRALLTQSRVSDVYSLLVAGVPLDASTMSDIRSAVNAVTVNLTASDISDIASAVVAALPITSSISDIYSMLSDFYSDFQSRVPKLVATDSQLLLVKSLASDAVSAAQQVNSRALINQSVVSDINSLLGANIGYLPLTAIYASLAYKEASQTHSVASDTYSLVTAGVPVGASDMSDLRSAITANGVLRAGADPTTVVGVTGTLAAKVDWITALARNKVTQTSALQTLYDDGGGALASAVVSDDGTTFTKNEWAG